MRNCPICCELSENLTDINNIKLTLVDDIILNSTLNVKMCKDCNFYFSESGNTQEDYNNYYLLFNNYPQQSYCPDKDIKCADFICKHVNKNEIKTIIDYGSGNGVLAKLLSDNFIVEQFDINSNLISNEDGYTSFEYRTIMGVLNEEEQIEFLQNNNQLQ